MSNYTYMCAIAYVCNLTQKQTISGQLCFVISANLFHVIFKSSSWPTGCGGQGKKALSLEEEGQE
jgi:hypothetical protein